VVGGTVYFWSTRGPAALVGGRVRLLGPDKLRWFVNNIFDWAYASRVVCSEDPALNMVTFIVPRGTNSSRPLDGASTAGICDYWLRWDYVHNVWSPPRQLDATDIVSRKNGTHGSTSKRFYLMAMGPHGGVLQMNFGASGTNVLDISGSGYDGLLATDNTTTSATFTLAGVSADDFNNRTVTLFYPTTDDNFPGRTAQKTILDTTVSGSSVTVTWSGALTLPSSTKWTVRIAGLKRGLDVDLDARLAAQIETDNEVMFHKVDVELRDTTGLEAVS
jgi:hypothetical protein